MPRRLLPWLLCLACLLPAPTAAQAAVQLHTVTGKVNLRAGPGRTHRVLRRLAANQSLRLLRRQGDWLQVAAISGQRGYVHRSLVSDTWIKVHKKERRLYVLQGRRVLRSFPVALSSFNPLGDKRRQGDGGTPEGRFFICETLRSPGAARYGARSLRLSYPGRQDARRGLAAGLIDYAAYRGIVRAIGLGRMPPQHTRLGGSIRIHGGGAARDWTLGCIALADADVKELFELVGRGTRVEVYRSAAQDRRLNGPDFLNRLLLAGARSQLKRPALYTRQATGLIRLSYPGGDIAKEQAVCTDIVIRALRAAGLDLQALVHEDILLNPRRYQGQLQKPNFSIDHRRTRVLQVFLRHHARVLASGRARSQPGRFQPGDILVMDTGIINGTVFDHIGIADSRRDSQGLPRVINIWTVGMRTSSMDLLGDAYPKLVSHFRLGHLFDYN